MSTPLGWIGLMIDLTTGTEIGHEEKVTGGLSESRMRALHPQK
jgi:hypothetical protein